MRSGAGFRSTFRSLACAASSSSCTHSRLGKLPNLQTEVVVVEMKAERWIEQTIIVANNTNNTFNKLLRALMSFLYGFNLIIPSYSTLQTDLSRKDFLSRQKENWKTDSSTTQVLIMPKINMNLPSRHVSLQRIICQTYRHGKEINTNYSSSEASIVHNTVWQSAHREQLDDIAAKCSFGKWKPVTVTER